MPRLGENSGEEPKGMEDHEADVPEPVELPAGDEDGDAPSLVDGLGALGQLAVAVLVVGVLIAAFIGGSALLRRIFG
jgi:hypothetical protein